MTATAISAIVIILCLLLYGYLKTKNAEVAAVSDKNEALEQAADKARKEDKAEDEAEAKEVIASGDARRAIGFLSDSWGRPADNKVPPA